MVERFYSNLTCIAFECAIILEQSNDFFNAWKKINKQINIKLRNLTKGTNGWTFCTCGCVSILNRAYYYFNYNSYILRNEWLCHLQDVARAQVSPV